MLYEAVWLLCPDVVLISFVYSKLAYKTTWSVLKKTFAKFYNEK